MTASEITIFAPSPSIFLSCEECALSRFFSLKEGSGIQFLLIMKQFNQIIQFLPFYRTQLHFGALWEKQPNIEIQCIPEPAMSVCVHSEAWSTLTQGTDREKTTFRVCEEDNEWRERGCCGRRLHSFAHAFH